MIDIDELMIGQEIIWLGSNADNGYGQRSVPAKILQIKKPDRVKIKVFTPNGEMIKYVSIKSIGLI